MVWSYLPMLHRNTGSLTPSLCFIIILLCLSALSYFDYCKILRSVVLLNYLHLIIPVIAVYFAEIRYYHIMFWIPVFYGLLQCEIINIYFFPAIIVIIIIILYNQLCWYVVQWYFDFSVFYGHLQNVIINIDILLLSFSMAVYFAATFIYLLEIRNQKSFIQEIYINKSCMDQ